MLRFIFQKHVDHDLRGKDAEFARIELLCLTRQFAQNFVADRVWGFYLAVSLAGTAWLAQNMRERFARAFACHFDPAQGRKTGDRYIVSITHQGTIKFDQALVLVFAVINVNVLANDVATKIAQKKLETNSMRGIQISQQ